MIFLIILYIVSVRFVLNKFEKKGGVFNLIFFFTLFHIVYTFMIPIEISYIKFTRFSNRINLSSIIYLFWSFIAFLGFVLPFMFVYDKEFKELHIKHKQLNVKKHLKNIYVYMIFFIVFGMIFFRDAFIKAGTYAGNVGLSENSFYKYFIDIVTMVVVVSLSLYFNNKDKLKGFLFLGMLAIWSLYSSDKNPIFLGFVGFLYGINNIIKLKKKYSFISLITFILILPIFAILFNNYRSGNFKGIELYKSLYSNSDPRGPFESIITAEKEYLKQDFRFGTTYLESTVNWIPSFIWKSRPEDLATSYAKENINSYSKGMGLGYSPIAEGVLNFGFLGPFFHYFFISCCIVILIKFQKRYSKNEMTSFIFYMFLIYFIVLMHRSPFNLPAVFFRIYLPLLLVFQIRKFTYK